jgi:DNA (cytosine-5)-methyltransferase 1
VNRLLIRNVSNDTKAWIESESERRRMSQNEFINQVLLDAHEKSFTLPLQFEPRSSAVSLDVPQPTFRFIDLFAGIGGFRSALVKLNGECVFSCEWDRNSQRTYQAWYDETPYSDIEDITPDKVQDMVPDHDVLAAGFPCQPFSIAGVSKRQSLGMAHGFDCETQGNLFFRLADIVEIKRPAVLFLENVKNLRSHDKGRTWKVIEARLKELRYWIFSDIIDAAGWVPQHRERVYIVCFDRDRFTQEPEFQFPHPPAQSVHRVADILEQDPDPKYTLTPKLWAYLQKYAEGHRLKGNGFGFGLAPMDGVSRTLSARYYKDGSEILISQGGKRPPRRLTPRECARLMGFDEKYQNNIVVSDTQAYRQFGNAVVPKVVEAIGRNIIQVMYRKVMEQGCLLPPPDLSKKRLIRKSA